MCKVYERLIRKHVLSFVVDKISTDQHGFVEKKSCLSNLLETVDTILEKLDDGQSVDVFYLDFCKAFDSVPHCRLLIKLKNMGITGNTLDIVRDFLSGRSMRTCVGRAMSHLRKVISGVPQGSVLGPLLFVLFINDLPDKLENVAKLFADDLKLVVDASDQLAVQRDLKNLEGWESKWMLKFNPKKCKVLHVPYNTNPMCNYVFDNTPLDSIESEMDLGVKTSESLFWMDQVKLCISKANQKIAWVTRVLLLRDKEVMLPILYIRLLLDHY